jgi:hypothetical protein
MNNKVNKEEFTKLIERLDPAHLSEVDFLYGVYEDTFDGILEINQVNSLGLKININSMDLIYYLLGEFSYSTRGFNLEAIKRFENNENIRDTMTSVIADKYLSLSLYNHNETKLTNRYLPPISSIELYINLMLNIVSRYERNNPNSTLIIDLLTKSLSIARCTLNLLCDGYETEALTMWRTLHECECILILLEKYQDVAINAYLKHMEYGLVYKDAFIDKDKQNALFNQMKQEMNEIGLKSKDMKKYIEYGWMLAIPETKNIQDFKLNFRDGLETLAGLHQYSQIYMTSSEILHSTPLLIYSNKKYFYYLTILNLYESFFRIEEVFRTLFFSKVSDEGKQKYLEMKKMYFAQLINIHTRELAIFKNIKKGSN